MSRILIDDIDKLKITKVKYYKVHFEYDNTKYVLVDTSDEDGQMSLYLRKRSEKNTHYYSTLVSRKITSIVPGDLVTYIGKGQVYSQIDKECFIKKLVELGFSDGLFSADYDDYIKEREAIIDEIDILRARMESLAAKWRNTAGHGSKTESLARKFQLAQAEKMVGAEDGEWCEKYNAHYGSYSEEYDGVLTDLRNLPVGTTFYCTNGEWGGMIGFNSRGRKTVITELGETEIPDDYHSLYIQ